MKRNALTLMANIFWIFPLSSQNATYPETQIAFTSKRDGNYEIYVMDRDGTNQINLTNNPAYDGFPPW